MAAIELILLQRVEKLGQMGEVVKVKPGYARNFLLPQKKALRATKDNLAKFEGNRVHLEAQNRTWDPIAMTSQASLPMSAR